MPQLLRSPRFWALTLAFISSVTGRSSSLRICADGAILGPFGHARRHAAFHPVFAGHRGTVLSVGWPIDWAVPWRLPILVFDAACSGRCCCCTRLFAATAVIVGLLGVHRRWCYSGAQRGAVGRLLARENFSRAYGLVNLTNLPFSGG